LISKEIFNVMNIRIDAALGLSKEFAASLQACKGQLKSGIEICLCSIIQH
jgi:hypothetical protein